MIRCSRCRRRRRNPHSTEGQRWNMTVEDGRVVGYLCPTCQTPEEDAEARRNLGTYDYSTLRVGADGRLAAEKWGMN